MKADKHIASYRRLRSEAFWRLLAADNGPVILALLQVHLYDAERKLPASVFHERIARDLEDLRAKGDLFPQSAHAYVMDWLAAGFIERRLPAGAEEEEYELSSATIEAVRFVASRIERRPTTTESRLATVIQQIVHLAEATDANPQTRIAALIGERQRIEEEIASLKQGQLKTLPEPRALERAREIIALADDLAGDFHRVREQFDKLNRELRSRIMDNEGNRGEVLTALFAGVDLIAESEEGQTFSAFWRLLTDPEQSAALEQALDAIMSRRFSAQLSAKERKFLLRLTSALLDEGGTVHETLQHFARSLKNFVQSREYVEQQRLSRLLREAQRAAIALKDEIKSTEALKYALQLTSSRLRSLSQWVLYDPAKQLPASTMVPGEAAPIDLESISELIAESEIDFRTLRNNIRAVLAERSQASIADVLTLYPAAQGLGSVIGMLALASQQGTRLDGTETVSWWGKDQHYRRAQIPKIYFLSEQFI
ncbi:MAG: DUF3375 domain-containing protein [Acidobacteriia bacterium]|nr:DUF3375 domain-containing protein [Terriglobia bacterium]